MYRFIIKGKPTIYTTVKEAFDAAEHNDMVFVYWIGSDQFYRVLKA
jgi:hypothetical protein